MELKVQNINGEDVGQVEVAEAIFGAEVKPHLFWEVVRWQQAKRRAGTHATKTRHQVNLTTAKAYRQKGTGRARHGAYSAPIFVGGGVAHGPSPRDYTFKVNKKTRKAALRSALSMKFNEDKLKVVDDFTLPEIKTRRAVAALEALGCERVLVVDGDNDALNKSMRNLPKAKYLHVAGLNVYDVLKYDHVIFTQSALSELEGRLS